MTLKGDPNFKGKLTCISKYGGWNLVNIHASSHKSRRLNSKSEKLFIDGIFLSKAYDV